MVDSKENNCLTADELALAKYRRAVLYLAMRAKHLPASLDAVSDDSWADKYAQEAAALVGLDDVSGMPLSFVLPRLVARLLERGPEEQSVRLRVVIKRLVRNLADAEEEQIAVAGSTE